MNTDFTISSQDLFESVKDVDFLGPEFFDDDAEDLPHVVDPGGVDFFAALVVSPDPRLGGSGETIQASKGFIPLGSTARGEYGQNSFEWFNAMDSFSSKKVCGDRLADFLAYAENDYSEKILEM